MPEAQTAVATLDTEAAAEVLAGMLRSECVPAEVRTSSPLPGIVDGATVFVPASLAHRARWLINSSKVSDAELVFAATGQLDGNHDQ